MAQLPPRVNHGHLPQELISEILVRLPVKSLLRFKCLSKSLCTLINTPHFIKSHSSQKFNLRKLIFQDSFSSQFHVYDVNVDLEQEILRLKKSFSSLWKRDCGYCKGLVLLYVSECRFALWNPSTRQYRYLPVCDFAVPPNYKYDNIVGWGLGYDDSIDDYKAFCIVNVKQKHQPSLPKLEVQVWIYELKSNIWRKVAKCFPFLHYKLDLGGCVPGIGHFSDSSMHWLIHDAWKSEILAFDVRKETFSLVPQPVCPIKSMRGVLAELHVLDGYLCVSYCMQNLPLHAYLYIRKNDGVDGFTWTELYSVTEPRSAGIRLFSYVKVLGHSKRGDKILLDFWRDGMVWYDLKKKHFEKVEVDINPNWLFPILCLESLVSVGGGGSHSILF